MYGVSKRLPMPDPPVRCEHPGSENPR